MILANYTPTPEFWLMLTMVVTGLGKFAWEWNKRRQDRQDRESAADQARKDQAANADLIKALSTITEERFDFLAEKGQERLKAIMRVTGELRSTNVKALNAANNVNAKIVALGQKLVNESETPQKVEVVNSDSNPVPVHEKKGE